MNAAFYVSKRIMKYQADILTHIAIPAGMKYVLSDLFIRDLIKNCLLQRAE